MAIDRNILDTDIENNPVAIEETIEELLRSILNNPSSVSSTAYDTAWCLRLKEDLTDYQFERCLMWIRDNQYIDGSWGSPIFHYHDRIISTLAAIIALYDLDFQEDHIRIKDGLRFLWQRFPNLYHDANDTIGFPVVIVALIQQAKARNLDIPPNLFRGASQIEKKLNMLNTHPDNWKQTTLHYSMEALTQYLPPDVQLDFGDGTGLVGASPAATIGTLLDERTFTERSLNYVQSFVAERSPDGGMPTVDKIDIFEVAWSLNNLRSIDWITPDHPEVRPLLDFLWSAWSNEHGVGFSRFFNVTDLDDTSEVFALLSWGGYPVTADVFAQYELDDYFCCYPHEIDPSVSAQLRMLHALQFAKDHPRYAEWSEKLIRYLHIADLHGSLWFDKWHSSPYYMTTASVWMLHGIVDDLLPARIKWIINSQHQDGGWGHYGVSTVEETAYSLRALLYWHEHIEPIDQSVIDSGAQFFLKYYADDRNLVPMWIGKALYTPYKVVKSSIYVVLHKLMEYGIYKGN